MVQPQFNLFKISLLNYFMEKVPGSIIECAAMDDTSELKRFVESSSVVIQATSLGLREEDPSPFPAELARRDTNMFDTIYKRTRFLADADAVGAPNSGGSAMLLHQGARSFEIWTGHPAPLEVMRETLNEARK